MILTKNIVEIILIILLWFIINFLHFLISQPFLILHYNFKTEYRFYKFIEVFVRTRIMDMKTFKDNMEDVERTEDILNIPVFMIGFEP